MPMGNSITYDENSFDEGQNIRPAGERISYRYKLYQLLTEAGYSFDFVGSENAGNDYFQNPEMDDNAGFPGIDKAQLAYLLETGYNQRDGVYESPGAYLLSYPADIILLHIGTNNLSASSSEVSDILDVIRSHDINTFILVARIINRIDYSSVTTTFNDNVELMVAARDDPRIISVNMETGAGINYSADMIDNLHPNTTGYNKMAAKWFQAIDNLNSAPVISEIPQQTTDEGIPFNDLSLDTFVSDFDDADNLIIWSFKQQINSNLSVLIDENRVLHVTPIDENWNGYETITLLAEDSGNGILIKKDSIDVVFIVQSVNDSPVITSEPATNVNEDETFTYTITANDIDNGDILTYSAPQIPAWLTLDPAIHVLSGIPTNDDVGTSEIIVSVSDGTAYAEQAFQLIVNNVNDLPIITSTPVLTVYTNHEYLYEITATDIDVGDELAYSAVTKPSWLTLTSTSSGGTLTNMSSITEIGDFPIVLKVSDGEAEVSQDYTLTVSEPSIISGMNNEIIQQVYPSPANDKVLFKFAFPGESRIMIFDIRGSLQKQIDTDHKDLVVVSIADLSDGIYFYRAIQNNKTTFGKFTKSF
jgi:hypothetical protein